MTICLVLNSRIGIKIPMMKSDVAEIKFCYFFQKICAVLTLTTTQNPVN